MKSFSTFSKQLDEGILDIFKTKGQKAKEEKRKNIRSKVAREHEEWKREKEQFLKDNKMITKMLMSLPEVDKSYFSKRIIDELIETEKAIEDTYSKIDDFKLDRTYNLEDLEKIDRWIISKVNLFIKNSSKYYKQFQVYLLMEDATKLLNDISNWYVRRNRRRFWKSENDTNKETAYYTLYTVIYNYIKVLSPVIPFLSEDIYLNLSIISSEKRFDSIHLSPFPKHANLFRHNAGIEASQNGEIAGTNYPISKASIY